jgi:hypothetical protein
MNLFAVSYCPVECAQALDDKRLIKMTLETAQMLCTAAVSRGVAAPYKVTHANHPVSVWVRANTAWMSKYLVELNQEYKFRFGKEHLAYTECKNILLFEDSVVSEFVNCAANKSLGLDFKHKNVLDAYKCYLNARWYLSNPKWTKRERPEWANYG